MNTLNSKVKTVLNAQKIFLEGNNSEAFSSEVHGDPEKYISNILYHYLKSYIRMLIPFIAGKL